MIMISSNRSPRELIDSSPPAAAEILEALAHKVIRIPELQERIEDLPLFVDHFLREAAKEFDRNIVSADPGAVERMKRYRWPGNVKELKILMEHVVMTAAGPTITVADLMIPELDGALSREPTAEHDGPVTPIDGDLNTPSGSSNEVETLSASNKGPVRVVTRWDIPQKTLNGRVVMYGQGLHSGAKTGLIISPLPAGSGIVFGHINSEGTVAARLENVISTEMATSLRGQDCAAGTIEHLMAVFNVYGLNNLLVKISGEVPIMDGSAVEFLNLVENAQIMSQGEPTQEITLRAPIELPLPEGSRKRMILEPSDKFQVHYFMDYPKPIGKLSLEFVCDDPVSFKNEIAPARTFGFVKDVKMMDEMGLAGGGRLSNLILVDDEKVVNPPLRFPDEFVRHKILDIIGDFYLLGRPIRAKVIAHQTGHSENIEMLKLIWENMRG
jgi:UDP-3-O-acyl N-acetylglucosamine deacetylase